MQKMNYYFLLGLYHRIVQNIKYSSGDLETYDRVSLKLTPTAGTGSTVGQTQSKRIGKLMKLINLSSLCECN
jgi:hypothetical protein